MVTEVILNRYPEDPVEIIKIRRDEEKSIEDDIESDGYKDVFVVEHIVESRGTQDVVKSWEIVIDY